VLEVVGLGFAMGMIPVTRMEGIVGVSGFWTGARINMESWNLGALETGWARNLYILAVVLLLCCYGRSY